MSFFVHRFTSIHWCNTNFKNRSKIFEDASKKGSVIVQGLEEIVVQSKEAVLRIMQEGSQKRKTAATMMNAMSSRSHTIFTITVGFPVLYP